MENFGLLFEDEDDGTSNGNDAERLIRRVEDEGSSHGGRSISTA
jgi:hypothetical protein